ncbi:hypothetical protein SUDANB15_02211 [Streptomyces sp. enrichment culture]|uniref:hypothetical protein n=1 Tax=Streptomyces sp. enrichment culture TaxID=1795815 RepID=UPI003F55C3B0
MVTLEVPETDSWLPCAVRGARGTPRRGAVPGAETQGMTAGGPAALPETLSTVPPVRERP